MRIGIITYDFAHLKTEQLVSRYVSNTRIKKINPLIHRHTYIEKKEKH